MADFSAVKRKQLVFVTKALPIFSAQRPSLKIAKKTYIRFCCVAAVSVHAALYVSVESYCADVLPQHAAHVLQDRSLLSGVAVYTFLQAAAIAVPNARPAQISFVCVAGKLLRSHEAL